MQNGTSMEHEMEATTHRDGRIMSGAAYTRKQQDPSSSSAPYERTRNFEETYMTLEDCLWRLRKICAAVGVFACAICLDKTIL